MPIERLRFLARFPTALLAALTATLLSLLSLHGMVPEQSALFRAAVLGLPLCFAFDVAMEMNERLRRAKPFGMLIPPALLFLFFLLADSLSYVQFTTCMIVAHLLVALIPFRFGNVIFWNYNRVLFSRYVVTSFFSLVLFVGVALAWASISALVHTNTYLLEISIVVFGLFHPLFFFYGIPDWKTLERQSAPSRNVQFFAERILIPVVALNLGVLYIFCVVSLTGKVAQPHSWLWGIQTLIVAAVLAHVLVWQEIKTSLFAKYYPQLIYLALLPIALMAMKIAYDDGYNRFGIVLADYYCFVFGIWVTLAVIYYGIMRKSDLRAIPLSLGIFALFTLTGPLGAERSVRRHFEQSSPDRRKQMDLEDRGIVEGKTSKEEFYEERRLVTNDYGSYETKGFGRFAAVTYHCCTSVSVTGGHGKPNVQISSVSEPDFQMTLDFAGGDYTKPRKDENVRLNFKDKLAQLWSAKDQIYQRGELTLNATRAGHRARLIIDTLTIRRYQTGRLEVLSFTGYLLF